MRSYRLIKGKTASRSEENLLNWSSARLPYPRVSPRPFLLFVHAISTNLSVICHHLLQDVRIFPWHRRSYNVGPHGELVALRVRETVWKRSIRQRRRKNMPRTALTSSQSIAKTWRLVKCPRLSSISLAIVTFSSFGRSMYQLSICYSPSKARAYLLKLIDFPTGRLRRSKASPLPLFIAWSNEISQVVLWRAPTA